MNEAQKGQAVEVQLAVVVGGVWFDQRHDDNAFFGEDQVVSNIMAHLF